MKVRFTIRDLLWLAAAAALAVGWWLDHRKLSNVEPKTYGLRITPGMKGLQPERPLKPTPIDWQEWKAIPPELR